MVEKFIDTIDGKVYYWKTKIWCENKKTLFFLHGMTGDHTMFAEQVNYFSEKYNLNYS